MKNAFFVAVAALLLFSSLLSAQSENEWELVNEKDGVKVYTKAVEGYKIKSMKMTSQLEGNSLSSFVAVFQDMSSYPDWVYSGSEPELLKKLSDKEIYYYVRSDFPWPMSDRDFVVHNRIWQDKKTHTFHSHSEVLKDYLDEKEDVVRIQVFEASWEITPNTNGRYDLKYTFFTDPAGNIPNWVVNYFLDIGPFKTIKNLEAQVKKEKYSNASYDFIKEPKF